MRFAVVDDEPGILKQIPALIKQFISSDVSIETDCFQNPTEFLETYSERKFDALFLDIDMPTMNGFELAEHLRNQKDDVPIVYITVRDDLIIHAFRYKALGFVRKQYIDNELPFAVSTIMTEIRKSNCMIEVTETRSAGGRSHTISIQQIMYIESIRHNVTIYLTDGRQLAIRSSLTYYTEHEDFEQFVPINSGTIVNLALIELTKDKVRFQNGIELFISRRKIQSVREAYLNYMKKVLI